MAFVWFINASASTSGLNEVAVVGGGPDVSVSPVQSAAQPTGINACSDGI